MKKRVSVLIVDDSAVARQALGKVLASDPEIEVMAAAADPYIAAKKMQNRIPDVITLDVEMPRMDGITFLQKLMKQHPIPVVICSGVTHTSPETALKAISLGAVEIISKPRIGTKQFFEEAKIRICDSVKAAAMARVNQASEIKLPAGAKLSADVILKKPEAHAIPRTAEKVVVVGASTGGTEALTTFLMALPYDAPGIVIVQHMPEHFTRAFSNRLNAMCGITVKEAENNDKVMRGRALIAPGNHHLLLKRNGTSYFVEIQDGPLVSRHRPSVDVLFRSAASCAGKNATGVIMTGMGDDGAAGMLEMKQAGAFTIAQNEETCVVFGMPKKAIELNCVDRVLALQEISTAVMEPVTPDRVAPVHSQYSE